MSRGLFEGHIPVEPGARLDDRDYPAIVEYFKDRAADFVAMRGCRNLGEMIFNRNEVEGTLTQVDFAWPRHDRWKEGKVHLRLTNPFGQGLAGL